VAKTDDLGRVRVLYLGATALTAIMSADPTLQMYPVPAYLFRMGYERVLRSLRMYMPRTYARLVGSNDVIHVCDSGASCYTPTWLGWMADAVMTDGLGFVMSGGAESFGGHLTSPSWGDTSVGEVLAVDCHSTPLLDRFFRMIVTRPDDPLMASLRVETAPAFRTLNSEASPKWGSVTLAVANLPDRNPVAVVIMVGRGRSVSFMAYMANPSASIVPFAGWESYTDFICNLMIYLAQAPLPPDYVRTHVLRSKLSGYPELRKMVIDILSFADRFGASTAQSDARIASADEKLADARTLFIRKDLDESEKLTDQAVANLDRAQALCGHRDRDVLRIRTLVADGSAQTLQGNRSHQAGSLSDGKLI
jgi:uncharacterized membrane protein